MNIISGNSYNRTDLFSILIIIGFIFLVTGYYLLRLNQDSIYLFKEMSKKENNSEKKKLGYLYIKKGVLTKTKKMKFLTSNKLYILSIMLMIIGSLLIKINFFRSSE